jgi:hypothetical protein
MEFQQCDDGQDADIVGGDFNFPSRGSKEFAHITKAIGPLAFMNWRVSRRLPTWDGLKSTKREAGHGAGSIFLFE